MLTAFRAEGEKELAREHHTPAQLVKLYRALYSKHGYGFLPPLSVKEKGMMAHFCRRCEGHGARAMRWAMADWERFRAQASKDRGWKLQSIAPTPRIAALLLFLDTAVNGALGKPDTLPASKFDQEII